MNKLPIVLGTLAGLTLIPAWVMPAIHHTPAHVLQDSKPVFGGKVIPEQISSLRVVDWDEAMSTPKMLEVKRSGTTWSILSHFDFPADANPKVMEACTGFLGVRLGRLVTKDPKRFEELGLVDPLDKDLTIKKGRGKRITMTDTTGKVVADLVVGNRSPGSEGAYFMREISSTEVYTAKVTPSDLSTKFVDYVEADPIKIKPEDIRELTIADYSVNEEQGRIDMRAETKLARQGAGGDWSTPTPPADKRVAQSAVSSIVSGLTSMKLAGVRPFEPQWLERRGFFLLPPNAIDPRLDKDSPHVAVSDGSKRTVIGNEGRLDITTKDGLHYNLMFGEVALDDEADTAADKAVKGDAAKTDDKKEGDKDKDGNKDGKKDGKPAGHNRYMVLFVSYEPSADEDAKKPPEEKKDDATGEKKPEPKKLSGKDRAQKAQERYIKYFYVISDDSFKSLRPALDKLFEAKPPEPMAGSSGKTNSAWLADNAKRPEVKTTASGLQYEVISSAPEGAKKAELSDHVLVNYKGMFVDGNIFDQSGDGPTSFGVTEVIKGWTEALAMMREGDHWKLSIKPELGYGEAGQLPKIPQNAILIFDVELVKIAK
ncbi:MAG: FKBP-type peptidyl-prolyl cis-trans isomerase [Planctomycetes bacterium]|nr:FKBP-type peptidyl-prolyl cis-trans isomerase [Planctomycetota bacterium]